MSMRPDDSLETLGKLVVVIAIGILAVAAGCSWIATRPSPAALFGCSKTFVNAAGEDTGECN